MVYESFFINTQKNKYSEKHFETKRLQAYEIIRKTITFLVSKITLLEKNNLTNKKNASAKKEEKQKYKKERIYEHPSEQQKIASQMRKVRKQFLQMRKQAITQSFYKDNKFFINPLWAKRIFWQDCYQKTQKFGFKKAKPNN